MEEKKLTCISCPLGCNLIVEVDGKEIKSVTGNNCKRGEVFAKNEILNPTRVITTTVPVKGSRRKTISVKSSDGIPKDKMFKIIDILAKTEAEAPVLIGDIVVENIDGLGVDIIATENARVKKGLFF